MANTKTTVNISRLIPIPRYLSIPKTTTRNPQQNCSETELNRPGFLRGSTP